MSQVHAETTAECAARCASTDADEGGIIPMSICENGHSLHLLCFMKVVASSGGQFACPMCRSDWLGRLTQFMHQTETYGVAMAEEQEEDEDVDFSMSSDSDSDSEDPGEDGCPHRVTHKHLNAPTSRYGTTFVMNISGNVREIHMKNT